jgi:hypothetical protein
MGRVGKAYDGTTSPPHMRHPFIVVVGVGLVALIGCGLLAVLAIAALQGPVFYGPNYKSLALSTYTTAAVIAVAVLLGFIWIGQRVYAAIERRRAGGPPFR